ncbi:MAG: sulfur oxidation c-type cytochrome SoxA [Nitrospirae bacterium]|nr:sulfur oxidation c-type cytochrome SoxA [Nitrospirota bacterium]
MRRYHALVVAGLVLAGGIEAGSVGTARSMGDLPPEAPPTAKPEAKPAEVKPRIIQQRASKATPEGRGDFQVYPDGKKLQIRYKGGPFGGVAKADLSPWRTYDYANKTPEPPVPEAVKMPADLKGDPAKGRKLFMDRERAPCTGCHLIPGEDVWPAGNIGPDLSTYGDLNRPESYTYEIIYDARKYFPDTAMPPWGTTGLFKPEEIVHLVAFLHSLKGPLSPEKDPNRNPNTRAKPVGFGDNLDPTNNPAVLLMDDAKDFWGKKGPKGKSCADCHTADPEKSMRGVAPKYPKYLAKYQRVMSIEDFLSRHAPETTGMEMLVESQENLNMSILLKYASNGLRVQVDTMSPEARAAYERGKAGFFKRVGQRNHACADCHTPDKGGGKFLGGRLLVIASEGSTKHFPTWRTNFGVVWDIRKRMQWCMDPLGMHMLPADAVEYAELELYLTAFDNGKPLSVPGIRH